MHDDGDLTSLHVWGALIIQENHLPSHIQYSLLLASDFGCDIKSIKMIDYAGEDVE